MDVMTRDQARAETAKILETLVTIRRSSAQTQGEIADRLGVSQPAVFGMEAGGHDCKLSTLLRYAQAIGAQLTVLISYVEPSDESETTEEQFDQMWTEAAQ